MKFSELNEYYYPYLIQEFYGSIKEVVKGESFSVKVKKKSQIVDVDFLASVLNLPNDGNRIGTFKDTRKLDGYDEKAFQLSIFLEGIMAEQNAKMDMLINRLDRQEWFMKKMAQMLFGESFEKFGDFGSYPHGTASPSNAKAAGPSEVKISEVEEEEEEHVETVKKEKEESKLAEVEVEKNDEKDETAKEKLEAEQEPDKEKSRESSLSHTKSNSSSENGKSEDRNGSRQEEEKEDAGNKEEEQSQDHPLINQTLLLLPLNQYSNHPSPYPCNMALEEPKHKPKSVLPIPPTIQVTMPEKDPPKNKKQETSQSY
ncbi:hypothetical protein GH714_031062 [Hevea brasiliensis]|uniref:Uncharacterized protein n=1 Tax=Hevea brasiliensis TaxID=3981 RepID=A0A6A6NBL5_HEVBR|nr:hypothetical protein GH714_031062 [Hevea brasiliensis]